MAPGLLPKASNRQPPDIVFHGKSEVYTYISLCIQLSLVAQQNLSRREAVCGMARSALSCLLLPGLTRFHCRLPPSAGREVGVCLGCIPTLMLSEQVLQCEVRVTSDSRSSSLVPCVCCPDPHRAKSLLPTPGLDRHAPSYGEPPPQVLISTP